jgi:hypothetical protein
MRARIVRTTALLLLGAAGARVAQAKDPAQDALKEASQAAAAKDVAKAADAYGRAFALLQKAHDLVGESLAADTLEDWFDGLSDDAPAAAPGSKPAPPPTTQALFGLMRALDPKRSGAFLSAHALATEILRDAVRRGDLSLVDDAAAVLVARGALPKAGKACAALAHLAEGMRAEKAGDAAAAETGLFAAANEFADHAWLAHAAAASTELAALRWRTRQDAAGVAAALKIPLALLDEGSDVSVVKDWRDDVEARLAGAPPAATDAFRTATDALAARKTPSSAGGRGGRDGGLVSEVGKHLARAPKDKPFVSVTRKREGFVVKPAWQKDPTLPLRFRGGELHWDAGGVTLGFADRAVALCIVDPEGTQGQPGERSRPLRVRAFYLLAAGETWQVSEAGGVAVTGP